MPLSSPVDSSNDSWSWPRAAALVVGDAVILYAALLFGYTFRFGDWLAPHTTEWALATPIVLAVYLSALAASGVYRIPPREMHLNAFIRTGAFLCGAWGASVALTYLVVPADIPPRSVMAVHGLVALVGILGSRAVLRRVLEAVTPTANPVPAPSAPDPLDLHTLVDRAPVSIDTDGLRDYLTGRTVLVTGAGGSIGSELSQQLLSLKPFRVVFVDVSEYNLYRLEQQMRALPYEGDMEFCIADVRDASLMDGLFATMQPDVVLHTAAYKHVPLMERHPAEAFRNNTLATVHLLRLSEAHNVEQFVFVSTDKAVAPSSVLGTTKRLAEWYVRTADLPCKIVRFGNVFGSQGSVVPLFRKQLEDGGPVTVTHRDMERYFMSVHEACGLILQTLLLDTAPVYIFRMGDPVRIRDLATRMIERWYPSTDPEAMIEYVGRRPGEKLSEVLTTNDETEAPTAHPSILGVTGPTPYSRPELEAHFQHLQGLSAHRQKEELRTLLSANRLGELIG